MTGFLQGRFTGNRKDFGTWINLAKPVGTSDGDRRLDPEVIEALNLRE